ncbi:MAG: M20/M25/M40 family metallo-hydrolase [Clostridia bacterium]|nr:M20/M25/M40 family metallo-hydrolase [Clostridia bacterium]
MLGRLEILSNLPGVSGDEGPVRRYIRKEIAPLVDEIRVDHIGNLYAYQYGEGPTVMLTAHMDEVGFQIRGILEDGLLAYEEEGIDPRVVLSKRVRVGKNAIPGVIGVKAHHLQKKSDFAHVLEHNELFIDIGAKDKADAEQYVEVGDYAWFDTAFAPFGEGLVKGKALDDRVGCAILMELLKKRYPCNLVAVFATQEEVGHRGATVAAQRVKPDLCLILEGTTANDTVDAPLHKQVTKINWGPAITFMDGAAIVPEALIKALKETAERNGIPWQLRRGTTGSTDAGIVQQMGAGCVAGGLSVPCRYIHGPCSVASVKDIENTYRLMDRFLEEKAYEEALKNG